MRFHASSGGESLELSQFDEADAGDGFDLAQGFDGSGGGGGVGDVDLDDGESLALGNALCVGEGGIGRLRGPGQSWRC